MPTVHRVVELLDDPPGSTCSQSARSPVGAPSSMAPPFDGVDSPASILRTTPVPEGSLRGALAVAHCYPSPRQAQPPSARHGARVPSSRRRGSHAVRLQAGVRGLRPEGTGPPGGARRGRPDSTSSRSATTTTRGWTAQGTRPSPGRCSGPSRRGPTHRARHRRDLPDVRYHPAIVAQAAATLALLSDGRFTLGLGSGERLNEHVVGRGWPSVSVRHEMLREALEIIRLLWQGGYHSYQGKHLDLDDARVFDLPDELPPHRRGGGRRTPRALAAELGDGIFATEPKPELADAYREAGGDGPPTARSRWPGRTTGGGGGPGRVRDHPLGAHRLEGHARAAEPGQLRGGLDGGATRGRRCGNSLRARTPRSTSRRSASTNAGYDHVVLTNRGPDPDGFIDFFARELKPALRR